VAVNRTYTRRSPETARTLILDAADRVFARTLPDSAGLREIAAEGGISHGLVTHYFGTYDALIDAVLERRLAALRSTAFVRLGQATFAPTESPMLDVLIELLDDPTLSRLVVWSLLVKRPLIEKPGQLATMIDAIHARLCAVGSMVSRERLEMSLVMTISMVAGWVVAGPALEHSAGRTEPIPREVLKRELHRMIRAYVEIGGGV
jgi:AcrR family transcriptional regulator